MDDLDPTERGTAKRDRTARLMRVASLLVAHPDGMRPKDIAERLGMSVRNVYRDLRALEGEYRRFEHRRRHRKQHVASGNTVVRKPMVVDDRRARVRHRPPQKARNTEGVLICHRLVFPFH